MDWDDIVTRKYVGGTQLDGSVSRLARYRQSLKVVSGPSAGLAVDVDGPHVRIGTGLSCDLVLKDDTVSRNHCELSVRDDRYVIRDLGSTNGTIVNGVEVTEAYIQPGMRFMLGESEVEFQSDRSWVAVSESASGAFGPLLGTSKAMRGVFGLLERVAPSELTCLVVGETGTGKDLAAQAIHEGSRRTAGPFVVVDCGSLHLNLTESELFGHEKGAFTGADRARPGAFELAKGGTVLLDEVGELSPELQPKLLRVLERRETKRLGGDQPVPIDVRVLAATHRDLTAMVDAGTFREDLFYRLAEVVVCLPPLRKRRDDIPIIARALADQLSAGKVQLASDALDYLATRPLPGNVRELRNMVRRAVTLSGSTRVDRAALERLETLAPQIEGAGDFEREQVALDVSVPLKEARAAWNLVLERRYVQEVMERHGNDVDLAAEHMGLHPKSLYRLIRSLGLPPPGEMQ